MSMKRLVNLGLVQVLVFLRSFGIHVPHLVQMFSELFPVKGLRFDVQVHSFSDGSKKAVVYGIGELGEFLVHTFQATQMIGDSIVSIVREMDGAGIFLANKEAWQKMATQAIYSAGYDTFRIMDGEELIGFALKYTVCGLDRTVYWDLRDDTYQYERFEEVEKILRLETVRHETYWMSRAYIYETKLRLKSQLRSASRDEGNKIKNSLADLSRPIEY